MDDCPFPIWSIFITADKKNPSTYRPGTYREPFWKGRTLVCVNDQSTATWLKEPWELWWNWTWTTKTIDTGDKWSATVISEQSTNYQPSISVYIWKRVNNTNNFNPFNITDAFQPQWNYFPENVIIDPSTMAPQQPNPYNP